MVLSSFYIVILFAYWSIFIQGNYSKPMNESFDSLRPYSNLLALYILSIGILYSNFSSTLTQMKYGNSFKIFTLLSQITLLKPYSLFQNIIEDSLLKGYILGSNQFSSGSSFTKIGFPIYFITVSGFYELKKINYQTI